MFRGLFSPSYCQSRSGKPLFLYSFWDVRINVCVSVTFVYFIVNPTIIPSSNKSSCLYRSRSFFADIILQLAKPTLPSRAIGLRDSQWGNATKLVAFRTCFRSPSARNNVDRSWTDLRPPPAWSDPGWVDPISISKKYERSHWWARIKARSIWDRSSPEVWSGLSRSLTRQQLLTHRSETVPFWISDRVHN